MRISSVGMRKPLVWTGLAAIGLAAGGLVAGSGAAAAATVSGAVSWPAQVAHPAAAACPAGQTLITPTGGWTDSLGVSHITYSSRPGMVDEIAPMGLTASRVTPALLDDLGLDAKGASKAAYQQHVSQALSMARSRTAPEFCYSPTPIAPPVQPTASTATARAAVSAASANVDTYSPYWGGTAITEYQSGSGINGAEIGYIQPLGSNIDGQGGPASASTWVGVGDDGDIGSSVAGLIQAGTEMQTGYGYRAFYEQIGTSGCVDVFCGAYSAVNAVSPGQSIYAYVYWENSTHACFHVDNGIVTIFNLCSAIIVPYDHTSAEWVNENMEGSGDEYADPGTVTLTSQSYSNSFNADQGESPFATSDFNLIYMGYAGNNPNLSLGLGCGNSTLMSYPTDGVNYGSYATSKIITCNNGVTAP